MQLVTYMKTDFNSKMQAQKKNKKVAMDTLHTLLKK